LSLLNVLYSPPVELGYDWGYPTLVPVYAVRGVGFPCAPDQPQEVDFLRNLCVISALWLCLSCLAFLKQKFWSWYLISRP